MLLDAAGHACKTVFLPRVRKGAKGEMDFAICRGMQDLACGAYNLLEPAPSIPACVFALEADCRAQDHTKVPPPDIFVIPGVAFDRQGQRLGFGGGYYDRFLASPLLREHSLFVGLAYSFQVLDRLMSESWDQPVDALCTDEGFELFRS
jgi:5-formyltetrahydrofolate cyclo-ligase